jgi:hypothetical protein
MGGEDSMNREVIQACKNSHDEWSFGRFQCRWENILKWTLEKRVATQPGCSLCYCIGYFLLPSPLISWQASMLHFRQHGCLDHWYCALSTNTRWQPIGGSSRQNRLIKAYPEADYYDDDIFYDEFYIRSWSDKGSIKLWPMYVCMYVWWWWTQWCKDFLEMMIMFKKL